MPTGTRLRDTRDLLSAVRTAPDAVLERHLLYCYLRPEFEVSHFPNDFAIWAAESLEDAPLAESLAGLDPHLTKNWDEVRRQIVDLVEDHLWEDPGVHRVRKGQELALEECASVIVDTGGTAEDLAGLRGRIQTCRPSAIFHHFHRPCFYQPDGLNDFSRWLAQSQELEELAAEINSIDFPYYTLEELRWQILERLDRYTEESDE
jgi:hypothetical protein